MELAKLALVVLTMVVLLKFKKPLWVALLSTSLVASILFNLGVTNTASIAIKSLTSKSTLTLVAVVYTITILQVCLEKRLKMQHAETAMSGLFNNRRINVMFTPIFMGLLPAPNSILLAAPIIDSASEGIFDNKQRAFIASYIRHVPECILPTYAQILIACQFSGVPLSQYLIFMLPMAAAMVAIVYAIYIRKIPCETGIKVEGGKGYYFKMLVDSMWPILAIIILVITLNVEVYLATIICIVAFVIINKFTFTEIKPVFLKAFNPSLIVNMVVVMLFKDIITNTGVINELVIFFNKLPIPQFLIFGIVFFLGVVLSGSQAMVALIFPIAFAAVPNAGIPLLVFLMSLSNSGMNLSPTHVCLAIVADYYKVEYKDLIVKTLPVIAIHATVAIGYYLLLSTFM